MIRSMAALGFAACLMAGAAAAEPSGNLEQPSSIGPEGVANYCYYRGLAFSVGAMVYNPIQVPEGLSDAEQALLRGQQFLKCVSGDPPTWRRLTGIGASQD